MEKKMKHMEMIQAIITRMASNSFALKGWAVTLVAALFALASKDANQDYYQIAFIPVLVFWGLDAYYLWQERLFRALYNKVRKMDDANIDFNMAPPMPPRITWRMTKAERDMVREKKKKMTKKEKRDARKLKWINCFCSITVGGFYFPLAVITFVTSRGGLF